MTKKQIDNLVKESYSGSNLDLKKVNKIQKFLKRADLKLYIRGVKNLESKKTVTVVVPNEDNKKNIDEKIIKKMFPNKKINYKTNPSLVIGARIINEDRVFDFNLENSLGNILEYIEKQYD